jgi:stage II sporulation protein D
VPKPEIAPLSGTIRIGLANDVREVRISTRSGLRVTSLPEDSSPSQATGREVAFRLLSTSANGTTDKTVAASGNSGNEHSYRIQVASLRDGARAEALQRELQSRFGVPVTINQNAATGTYRVRAGEFHSHREAEAFAIRLQEAGYALGWVATDEDSSEPAHSRFVLESCSATLPLIAETDDHSPISGLSIAVRPAASVGVVRISPLDPQDFLTFDNGRYRGSLEIVNNVRGQLNVVNVVDLEDYLKGVVPNEMPPAKFDAVEALKAQAIAARTYALKNNGRFLREGYQLCATIACQVYRGVNSERPLSSFAVEATRGIVIKYNGELIDSLYTSTCGGRTEDAQNIFRSTEAPYLRGVSCPPEDKVNIDPRLAEVSGYHLHWNVRVSRAEMEKTLQRTLSLDELVDLEPLRHGSSGRVIELRVVGHRRQFILRGLEVKSALGLKDSLFTLKRVLDRNGRIQAFDFSGSGWGHGVGLCQTGAYGLARQGLDYISILKTYYTGVDVVQEDLREN